MNSTRCLERLYHVCQIAEVVVDIACVVPVAGASFACHDCQASAVGEGHRHMAFLIGYLLDGQSAGRIVCLGAYLSGAVRLIVVA